MTIKTEFPHAIREIENTWIPLSDGAGWRRASGCRKMPTRIRFRPCWSTSPIARTTAPRSRDASVHPYFAGHGYACVRVDMRGSGDSDGILYDEYLLAGAG